MNRILLTLCVLLMACSRVAAPTIPEKRVAKPVVIEIFGTHQVTVNELISKFRQELYDLCASPEPKGDIVALLTKIGALGDFADVEPSVDDWSSCYVMIDFVDREDAARRMPFAPEPTGTYLDPEGLLDDWRAYESKVLNLEATQEGSSHRVTCPAFHCLGDHTHPALRQLADKFVARVPLHVEELATILRDDHRPIQRAAAAYLLAYTSDGAAVVNYMLSALRDPIGLVRSNAGRVLADIALYHPELAVPFEPVLTAIDYPCVSDRNKAAAILYGLLKRPDGPKLRRPIIERAGHTLLNMLRLQQPNNHTWAYLILKDISGKDFGERDYAAWEAWLSAAAGPTSTSTK